MVHHPTQVRNACSVGTDGVTDGLTPIRRWHVRKFGSPLAGFGARARLREPPLEKVTKFSPWCVEARLLGFSLEPSRYIVVFLRGRYRLVRTVKRSQFCGQVENRFAERPYLAPGFRVHACWSSRAREGCWSEVNPAAQQLDRAPVDAPATRSRS